MQAEDDCAEGQITVDGETLAGEDMEEGVSGRVIDGGDFNLVMYQAKDDSIGGQVGVGAPSSFEKYKCDA